MVLLGFSWGDTNGYLIISERPLTTNQVQFGKLVNFSGLLTPIWVRSYIQERAWVIQKQPKHQEAHSDGGDNSQKCVLV